MAFESPEGRHWIAAIADAMATYNTAHPDKPIRLRIDFEPSGAGKSWPPKLSIELIDEPVRCAENVFRKEGEYWTIAYGGSICRLKDCRGLQYITHLLRNPNLEFHARDLVALVSVNPWKATTESWRITTN